MIQRFVDTFMAAKPAMTKALSEAHPEDYTELVKRVVAVLSKSPAEWPEKNPDPERITVIDNGDYQGTLLYVIAEQGYQPDAYFTIFVDYGSCSGCDTLEAIRGYRDDAPSAEQVGDYWTLMLHMVQSMRPLRNEEAA